MNYANNTSLFISFATTPFTEDDKFREDIDKIFEGYKEKQIEIAKSQPSFNKKNPYYIEFEKYLYRPSYYNIFGSHDVAIVSLTDDYTLANRNFHPYSYYIRNKRKKGDYRQHTNNFKYQIITGTTPILDKESIREIGKDNYPNYNKNPLINTAKNTFLRSNEIEKETALGNGQKLYPFIGISRIKLNNGILVGSGAKFAALVETVLHYFIKAKIKETEGLELDFIISESVSWHELTIVFFSNDLKKISDIIVEFREWRLLDIRKKINEVLPLFGIGKEECLRLTNMLNKCIQNSLSQQILDIERQLLEELDLLPDQKPEEPLIQKYESNDFIRQMREELLARKKEGKQQRNISECDIENSHVFLKTLTSFGYDHHLVTPNADKDFEKRFHDYYTENDGEEHFFLQWTVKPGHLEYVLKQFEDYSKEELKALREKEQNALDSCSNEIDAVSLNKNWSEKTKKEVKEVLAQLNKGLSQKAKQEINEVLIQLNEGLSKEAKQEIVKVLAQLNKGLSEKSKQEVEEILKKVEPNFLRASFVAGPGDYLFPSYPDQQKFRNVVKFKRSLFNKGEDDIHLETHVRKLSSLSSFEYSFEDLKAIASSLSIEPKQEYQLGNRLKHFAFTLNELGDLRLDLMRCNVSKILREKVINIFVNFNDGVRDPILFPCFLGLKQFLKEIHAAIKFYGSDDSFFDGQTIHKVINDMADQFEIAYRNRFHQSYRMDGVTDFNIEYNGGTQQIVIALEGAYKSITTYFADHFKRPPGIVLISGTTGVYSNQYAVRINYFHLFQPSIFLFPSVKEAANHLYYGPLTNNKDSVEKFYFDELEIAIGAAEYFFIDLVNTPKFAAYKLTFDPNNGEPSIGGTLRSTVSDLFTFMLGMNGDDRLFTHWSWGHFLQISEVYNTDSSIHYQLFVKFLFRYISIMKFIGKGDELIKFDEHIRETALYPCRQIRSLWISHFDHVLELHDTFLNQCNFFGIALNCALQLAFRSIALDLLANPNSMLKLVKEEAEAEEEDFRSLEKKYKETVSKFDRLLSKSQSFNQAKSNPYIADDLENIKNTYNYLFDTSEDFLIKNFKQNGIYNKELFKFYAKLKMKVSLRQELLFKRAIDIRMTFEKGEIYQFRYDKSLNTGRKGDNIEKDAFENEGARLYIQSLHYGYLKLLFEDFMGGKNKTDTRYPNFPIWQRLDYDWEEESKMLFYEDRREGGKGNVLLKSGRNWNNDDKKLWEELCLKYQAELCFDSMGGLHAMGMETRRNFYKYRSAVIRSLWDYSMQNQKNLLF